MRFEVNDDGDNNDDAEIWRQRLRVRSPLLCGDMRSRAQVCGRRVRSQTTTTTTTTATTAAATAMRVDDQAPSASQRIDEKLTR